MTFSATTPLKPRTLPWVTAVLAIALLLCFVWASDKQTKGDHLVLNTYLAQGLFEIEREHYLDYQVHKVRVDFSESEASYERLLGALYSDEKSSYAWLILEDRAFYKYLKEHGQKYMQRKVFADWRTERENLESLKSRVLPNYRFGLNIDSPNASSLVTSAFIESDPLSFSLNLLLLSLVLGFIELRRGHIFTLVCFAGATLVGNTALLVTTPFPTGLYTGLNTTVSGLFAIAMGLVFVRWKKNNTGMSLLVTGLLLGFLIMVVAVKSYLQWWLVLSPLEQIIASGLGFIICALTFSFHYALFSGIYNEASTKPEPDSEEESLTLRIELDTAMQALSRFEFSKAKALFNNISNSNPLDKTSAQQGYFLTRHANRQEAASATNIYAQTLVAQQDTSQARSLLRDLQQNHKAEQGDTRTGAYPLEACATLVRLFLLDNDFRRAERSFNLLKHYGTDPNLVKEAGYQLYRELKKQGMDRQASRYFAYQAS